MKLPARTSRYARASGWPLRYPAPPDAASARSTIRAEASFTNAFAAWVSANSVTRSLVARASTSVAARDERGAAAPSSIAFSATSIRDARVRLAALGQRARRRPTPPPPRCRATPTRGTGPRRGCAPCTPPRRRPRSRRAGRRAGTSTPANVTEWLPEARMPSASQSPWISTPAASGGDRDVAVALDAVVIGERHGGVQDGRRRRAGAERLAAVDPPAGVGAGRRRRRAASGPGRARVIAAAMITPSRAIACSEAPNAFARRRSSAASPRPASAGRC